MHLGLMAYQLAKEWDVETTAKMCKDGHMESFEFFAEPSYKQKISLDMQPADAKKTRKTFADSGAHRLAVKTCKRITGTAPDADMLRAEKRALGDSRSKDAMNEPPGFPPTGSWVQSRGGSVRRSRWDGTSR